MESLSKEDALERFETIWQYVECGIAIIDAQTREILDINPVAVRMFGDEKEKIIGKRCHKFVCPAEECSCPIMDKGMVVDRSERKFVKANGEMIPIIKSVAKINYNGRLALLESFTDISNLKEAEEKLRFMQITEQANKAKSDFLSRMSHEIRTPMNAIIGMTQIAESTDDIDKLKHCLSTIALSSEHLLGLINDILDMSKIEAGKFELDCVPMNIEKMLSKIYNLLADKIEHKKIKFAVELGKDMRLDFVGDELRLSQIITNILSNAVKFTPEGGSIKLSAREIIDKDTCGVVQFVVEDTGIGMTKEQIGKLFNAFEQADTSISRRFGGTGLGLAISKNIAEKMQGSITVESEPAAGSKFIIEVQLTPLPRKQLAQNAFADKKILVADSEQSVKEFFTEFAEKNGLSVVFSENGMATLDILKVAEAENSPYDAVIVSLDDLPDMDGLALCKLLSEHIGKECLILTSSFLQWARIDEEVSKAGIENFIAKPFFTSNVSEILQKVLLHVDNVGAQKALKKLPDFSNVYLLLAEDVEINQEIFFALLEKTNIKIDIAENGLEAVAKFKANPGKYDMIMMDIQMPDMDGYEATRQIRALDDEFAKSIPIVAMTANVFKEDVERCLTAGMNDHVAKPIDIDKVIEKILLYCDK